MMGTECATWVSLQDLSCKEGYLQLLSVVSLFRDCPPVAEEPLTHGRQPEGGPNSLADLDGTMRARPFHSNGGQS